MRSSYFGNMPLHHPAQFPLKDQLFLLKPTFFDGERGPLYCSASAAVEGILSFYPELRSKVDVHYINPPRPCRPLVNLIGAENEAIPVLVMGMDVELSHSCVNPMAFGMTLFINGETRIREYLSSQYGVGQASDRGCAGPRGTAPAVCQSMNRVVTEPEY